jgi:hypothetical protein
MTAWYRSQRAGRRRWRRASIHVHFFLLRFFLLACSASVARALPCRYISRSMASHNWLIS